MKTMLTLSPEDEDYFKSINKLSHCLASKGKVIVITGAGISVSSGIPVLF